MMEDMAVVYRFVLESNEESRSSILVTNNIIDKLGVTPEQLKMDAMEIAPEHRPAVIQGMNELMIQLMGEEVLNPLGFHLWKNRCMLHRCRKEIREQE